MSRFFTILTEKDRLLPIYVEGVGIEDPQEHIVRNEGFYCYHLAVCLGGSGKLFINNKEYIIQKDMCFFFNPGISHEYFKTSDSWVIKWLIFSGSAVQTILDAINFDTFQVFKIRNIEEFYNLFNKIYKTITLQKMNYILESSSLIYTFLTSINNYIEVNESENKSDKSVILDNVIDYIKSKYSEDISLTDLSKCIHVSTSYLCRIFNQSFGMSPFTYLLRYRIHVAKELLVNSQSLCIKDIAFSVGFNDASYFSSVFKEHEGCTPNQFRKLYNIPD